MIEVNCTLKNIFDSHCHYDDHAFDEDRHELLGSMLGQNVSYIVHASTDHESALFGISLSEKYPHAYTSVGWHPENLDSLPCDYIEKLEELISANKKVVAIGEIGLDYHYEGYDREKQIEVFSRQIELAIKHSLPIIVHSREATADTMEILRKYRPSGVVHCFGGSFETAREVISLGMYIGFTGVLTFKNAKKAVSALEAVPSDRLLLETDCPYMAPDGYRGKRCDSRMIYRIAEKVASLRNISAQEVIDTTNENACRLFGIHP
ncbi:MAG: TatD family hydrolase [Oscillospiraceae bacterium]|nr:TatD family hydrolase [Oscillospiraceae bacterium]